MQSTLSHALRNASATIHSESPLLDAEILLMHVLNVPRSYLHTYPETILNPEALAHFKDLVTRRERGEPIAYLTGHREFWSLDLIVTPDVLIPRMETELLVELLLKPSFFADSNEKLIADLGTGSGAIALALGSERPNWQIHAVDQSAAALKIAELNAKRLNIPNVIFHQGNWCDALPKIKFHAIVSNPPYIDCEDDHLTHPNMQFEPKIALVSPQAGLADITAIINQAKQYLAPGGCLLLEHGYQQASKVSSIFVKAGYTDIYTYCDLAGLERVTIATMGGTIASFDR